MRIWLLHGEEGKEISSLLEMLDENPVELTME